MRRYVYAFHHRTSRWGIRMGRGMWYGEWRLIYIVILESEGAEEEHD